MWDEEYYRFPTRKAFLNACEAEGWPLGPDKDPVPPEGITYQLIGPDVDPPTWDGQTLTPGEVVDPRFFVLVSYHAGTPEPASFKSHQIVPERPIRVVADRRVGQKLARQKARFAARKLAKPDDNSLVPERAYPLSVLKVVAKGNEAP